MKSVPFPIFVSGGFVLCVKNRSSRSSADRATRLVAELEAERKLVDATLEHRLAAVPELANRVMRVIVS
jgi:hypothetical protein